MNRRIIYLLEPFDFPSGGVAVIYSHVAMLASAGYPAIVGLPRAPSVDFYKSAAPIAIHNGRMEFKSGDIYVIPEGFVSYLNALRSVPVRKVMFCQNHYFLPFTSDSNADFFSEFGVDSLVVSSQTIKNFVQDVYRLSDIPVIPCSIDQSIFKKGNKKRQIAYMPRKLPYEAKIIKAAFQRLYMRYSSIQWIPIDRVSKEEAAKIMSESEVFLGLSNRDSLGLPPLEAMSCGCLVVGFYGDGGREYMTDENGFWSEDGNWRKVVADLERVFEMLDSRPRDVANMRNAMNDTVRNYSPHGTKSALFAFWDLELEKPFFRN